MAGRTKPCPPIVRKGRLRKAEQFWLAAGAIRKQLDDEDVGDAFVILCVHAGIATADVVCCAALAKHAQGESHADAVVLLNQVSSNLQDDLAALLAMKTRSGYSHELTSAAAIRKAERAANRLMTAARRA